MRGHAGLVINELSRQVNEPFQDFVASLVAGIRGVEGTLPPSVSLTHSHSLSLSLSLSRSLSLSLSHTHTHTRTHTHTHTHARSLSLSYTHRPFTPNLQNPQTKPHDSQTKPQARGRVACRGVGGETRRRNPKQEGQNPQTNPYARGCVMKLIKLS